MIERKKFKQKKSYFLEYNFIVINMNLIPNTSPELFSLSAVVVGYLLIDDMTANEQNALGNWLMLVGQLVSTNAYYAAVASERNKPNKFNNQDTLKMLEKMVKALKIEVDSLKEEINNHL